MTTPFPPTPKNPWITKTSQRVFESPWINVEDHEVETPAGTPGRYGLVRFKNYAVGIIPYEAGKIWMVGQTRYALNAYSWEIPEGGVPIDTGEDMETAARRELAEETGLRAKKLTHLFNLHTSNSVTDEYGEVFLATGLTQGKTDFEDTEDISIISLELQKAVEAIETGLITDLISIAAIYKLRLMQALGELS